MDIPSTRRAKVLSELMIARRTENPGVGGSAADLEK
jgi:hypothetical protein